MENNTAPASSAPASTPTQSSSSSPSSSSPSSFAEKFATASSAWRNDSPVQAPVAQEQTADKGSAETNIEQTAPVEGAQKQGDGKKAPANVVEYNGRRFDFSDPQKVAKKLVDVEAGMRKFQQERDQLKAELAKHTENSPIVEKGKAFAAIEKQWNVAYQHAMNEDGSVKNPRMLVAGVDKFLEGMFEPAIISHWLQAKLQLNSHLMNMPQEERQRFLTEYTDRQNMERERIELELERGEVEGYKSERAQAQEAADKAQLNAIITPARSKYSFKNEFANKRAGEALDNQLWADAKVKMKEHLNNGGDLSNEVVDQIFKGLYDELKMEHDSAVNNSVGKAVAQKKEAAMSGIIDAAGNRPGPKPFDGPEALKTQTSGEVLRNRFAAMLGR